MSSIARPYDFIAGKDLVSLLTKDGKEKIAVVDVRDSDYEGGHIRGCLNIPAEDFEDDDEIEKLIQKLKTMETVVFHCMKSQMRGPFCARRFAYRSDALLGDGETRPKIVVLAGGFEQFIQEYHKYEFLFEGVRHDHWILE